MLKALIKKQFASLWYGITSKRGNRGKRSNLLYAFLFIYVFGYFGVMNYNLFKPLCIPFSENNLDWLYFSYAAIFAVIFSTIGGVFTVQSQLYEAKDNDSLLSMPIPPIKILISRLLPIYAQSFVFSSLFVVAAYICYAQSVPISATTAIAWVILCFALPCVGLILCCLLGGVTAWISSKLSNKNIFTIVVSLIFAALYFAFAFRMDEYMTSLITNANAVGGKIKLYFWLFYKFGQAACGDYIALVLFLIVTVAAVVLTFLALSYGYLRIITTKKAQKKPLYNSKQLKSSSTSMALLRKEYRLFFGNAAYLLNCGLGSVFLLAASVYLVFSGNTIVDMVSGIFPDDYAVQFFAIMALCGVCSMNVITAPSISLEGNSLWLIQCLPISTWQALKAKLLLHISVTTPFAVACGTVLAIITESDWLTALMVIATPVAFIVFVGCLGLIYNLKKPNFQWETVTAAVKQSLPVLFTVFSGWAILSLFIILFVTGVFDYIPSVLSCYLPFCIFVLGDAFMIMWLKDKGTKLLMSL